MIKKVIVGLGHNVMDPVLSGDFVPFIGFVVLLNGVTNEVVYS